MNNLKKLKLLVASALLSSTAFMLMTVQTPQRRTVVLPSQVIKPSILVLLLTWKMYKEFNITSSSNTLTIDGDITVNSSVTGAVGLNINNGGSNNVINMTGDISTISTGGAVTMHGIRIGTNQAVIRSMSQVMFQQQVIIHRVF